MDEKPDSSYSGFSARPIYRDLGDVPGGEILESSTFAGPSPGAAAVDQWSNQRRIRQMDGLFWISTDKRYDPIGSAPARKMPARG
jgi:hypothetical protein